MTNVSALMDTVALLLLRNIGEGMETGRITNMRNAQTEVEAAIAELDRRHLLESPTHINDLVGKLLLKIGSLHDKVAKCESQLAEFQSRADALKEETTQIVARTEACNLLVEQQRKENTKVLAAMEGMKASITTAPPPCLAPAPSPIDPTSCPTPSRMAIVSFPGGPRTVTIHPPGSPNYQSTIRDEKGDVIVTLKSCKPLRREGAFRGPIEDIDWVEIHRVYGRGPDLGKPCATLPMPRWPDRSQPSPSPCPPPPRGSGDVISMQRQLSASIQTDPFGRVLPPEYLAHAKSPSLPIGTSSSQSSRDTQSSPSAKDDVVTTPCSTPPSPFVGRGKKRTRDSEEHECVPESTVETHDVASPLLDAQAVQKPTTPTPAKREESRPPEGPAKRKKLRSSASAEALSDGSLSLSCSYDLLDLARTV